MPAPTLRTLLAVSLAFAPVVSACTGDGGTGPSPTPSTGVPPSEPSSPSPSISPSSSPKATTGPSPAPGTTRIQVPADTPTDVADPDDLATIAAGTFDALVPPGSAIGYRGVAVRPEDLLDQIVLTWRRGEDPFAAEQGLVLWQLVEDGSAWRVVYAFTDKPSKGVLGVSVETGDLTGDGIADLLTREDVGGSGACAVWRVVVPGDGTAGEVLRRMGCDTEIGIVGGALQTREAVFEPDDAHCCPSAFRSTTLEWDGEAFVVTSETLEPTG